MTPFFSIGVTTYNRTGMLKECLSSILEQTFSDFEVIVGNDYTAEPISGKVLGIDDPRIRFVNYAHNVGALKSMNLLLEMGRGRYFTWLADDDGYDATFLEAVHESLAKFDFPPCVFTSYRMLTDFGEATETSAGERQLLAGREFLRLYLSRSLETQGCYGVFDTGYLRGIGGMEQLGDGFSPYSDNLLAIRAGLLKKVVYINAPLVLYRAHEGSISWISTDVNAYSGAQQDLCRKSLEVLRSEELRDDFDSNLFLLLKWCVNDYYWVMHRSGSLRWRKLIGYLLSMMRYARLLRGYRYKIAAATLAAATLRRAGRLMAGLIHVRLGRPFGRKARVDQSSVGTQG